jgi:hypothetical protein
MNVAKLLTVSAPDRLVALGDYHNHPGCTSTRTSIRWRPEEIRRLVVRGRRRRFRTNDGGDGFTVDA